LSGALVDFSEAPGTPHLWYHVGVPDFRNPIMTHRFIAHGVLPPPAVLA
jgi:hypothetical protein